MAAQIDFEETLIANLMTMHGLSKDTVVEMLLADDELDGLCETVLHDFGAAPQAAAIRVKRPAPASTQVD